MPRTKMKNVWLYNSDVYRHLNILCKHNGIVYNTLKSKIKQHNYKFEHNGKVGVRKQVIY